MQPLSRSLAFQATWQLFATGITGLPCHNPEVGAPLAGPQASPLVTPSLSLAEITTTPHPDPLPWGPWGPPACWGRPGQSAPTPHPAPPAACLPWGLPADLPRPHHLAPAPLAVKSVWPSSPPCPWAPKPGLWGTPGTLRAPSPSLLKLRLFPGLSSAQWCSLGTGRCVRWAHRTEQGAGAPQAAPLAGAASKHLTGLGPTSLSSSPALNPFLPSSLSSPLPGPTSTICPAALPTAVSRLKSHLLINWGARASPLSGTMPPPLSSLQPIFHSAPRGSLFLPPLPKSNIIFRKWKCVLRNQSSVPFP